MYLLFLKIKDYRLKNRNCLSYLSKVPHTIRTLSIRIRISILLQKCYNEKGQKEYHTIRNILNISIHLLYSYVEKNINLTQLS